MRCANKRSECWTKMAEWLKAGAIPNDEQLKAELLAPNTQRTLRGLFSNAKRICGLAVSGRPIFQTRLASRSRSQYIRSCHSPGVAIIWSSANTIHMGLRR